MTGGHRFLVLDSLRGICACMVAIGHIITPAHINQLPVFHSSHLFVDFFFVLSGFVIAASYGDRLANGFSIARFMALRLGRVYPLHLLILLIMLAVEILAASLPFVTRQPFDSAHSWQLFWANLLLLQIFVGPEITSWNAVSWSIAAEVWAYLIFAGLFRIAGQRIAATALLFAVSAGIWAYFTTDHGLNLFHDGALPRCLYGFGLGVLGHRFFAVLQRRRMKAPLAMINLAEIGLVVAVGWLVSLDSMDKTAFVAPVLFLFVVLVFAFEGGMVSRTLALGPFVLIGSLSYSIYMVHHFIELRFGDALMITARLSHGRIALGERVGPYSVIGLNAWQGDVLVIVLMAAIIGLAWLTYRFVEHPARVWSRKYVLGDRASPKALATERDAPTF